MPAGPTVIAGRRRPAPPRRPAGERSGGVRAADPTEALPLDRDDFVEALQREKRRAERSHEPLSLTLFLLDARRTGAAPELVSAVLSAMRETDIVGQIDASTVAVLCPGADEDGAARFVQRALDSMSAGACSTATATYPHRLFEELHGAVARRQAAPELALLDDAVRQPYKGKRLLDIVGGLCALVLLSPLMLLAAAAVAATSRGPVIFRQRRLGQGGRPFTFYKFRSMVSGADDAVHRAFVDGLIRGGAPGPDPAAGYKLAGDARITRVGGWLRRTSIDELPQLFNVLRGDMSLVGPRPPLPYEADIYQPWHRRRVLDLKPGMTGLWQVAGRSRVSFDDMVRMDIQYIRRCSLRLDLDILRRTVGAVVRGDGAA